MLKIKRITAYLCIIAMIFSCINVGYASESPTTPTASPVNVAKLANSVTADDMLTATPTFYYWDAQWSANWYPFGVNEIDNSPEKIVDGNTSSYFISKKGAAFSGTTPHYITLNWDTAQKFNTAVFTTKYAKARGIKEYNIETTTDGAIWIPTFEENQTLDWQYFLDANNCSVTERKKVNFSTQENIIGARIAIYSVYTEASNADYALNEFELYFDNNNNTPPYFDAINDKTVPTGKTLSFSVKAAAWDGHSIAYSLADGMPSWAAIDPASGQITIINPADSDAGNYTLTIKATDTTTGAYSYQDISLAITQMENIASLANIDTADKLTADYAMPTDYYKKQAGEAYFYPDGTTYLNNSPEKLIDGDKTTFFASKINTDMGGEPSESSPHYINLSWDDPQNFNEIAFTADFGNQKSILNYNIEVTKDNSTWTKLFNSSQKLNWMYSVFNFHDKPNPKSFTETIKVQLPQQSDISGLRVVITTAPDANWGQAAGRSYWLNELEVYNNPEYSMPQFTEVGSKTFLKNTNISFKVTASANNMPITYTLVNPPEGMTIGSDTGIISWTTPETAGDYSVVARATNSLVPNAYAEITIPISVLVSASSDVWAVNALQPIYQADTKPDKAITDKFDFVMAKHEYESAQIAIRSNSDFSIYKLEFSDLVSGSNVISNAKFKYGFPEYRISDVALPSEFNYIANTETTNLYPGSFVDQLPDPISNEQSIDINANTTQPIYFTIYAPKDAVAGLYTGMVTLKTSMGDYTFNVKTEVCNSAVPDIKDSALTVYNWTAIYGMTREKTDYINQYYGSVKYSDEWWSIIDDFAKNMQEHRQNMHMMKPMTFLSDHGYTLDSFTGDAVPVIAAEDWAEFDKYMQILIDYGYTNFSLDHLVDKLNTIVGDSEKSGTYDKSIIKADGTIDAGAFPVTDKFVTNYLTAVKAHLEAKGWLDENKCKWYLHIYDEPSEARPGSLPWWSYVTKLSKSVAPEFKIGDAGLGYYYPEIVDTYIPEMKDYYLAKGSFDSWFEQYKDEGKEKWAYSLGHDTELNRLTNQPTLTSRLVFWDFSRNDITGYLNWAWNAWWDGEYYGDTYEVYPDAKYKTVKSSLRYEAQRDGIEEYELLSILKSNNSSLAYEILNTAVKSRTEYTLDVEYIKSLHDYLVKAVAGQSVGEIPEPAKPYVEVVNGSELINNSDSRINYSGTGWNTVLAPNATYTGAVNTTKADGSYEDNVSTTIVNGDSAELNFYGYGINVYVEKNRSMGKMDIYIDGELDSTVDAHEDVLYRFYPIYTNYSLTDGPHTIKIVNRENVNNQNKDGSNKSFLVLDAFRVYSNTDPSKGNDLVSVSAAGGELSREFVPYVSNYDMEVKNDVEVVTLTPAAKNADAVITVNGTKIKNSSKITVYPEIGKNIVTITVKYNGVSKDYVFNITRLSKNMSLTATASADNAITADYVQTRTGWNYGMGEHTSQERAPSKINDGDINSFFITKIRYDFDGYIDDATSQRWGFVDGIEQRRFFTSDGEPVTYYITLNWDNPQTFDTLKLFTQMACAWGIHRYNIETTVDGTTWEPVFSDPQYFNYTTYTAEQKDENDVLIPVQKDKLGVRLAITAASYWGSEAYALNELEVYRMSEVQPRIDVVKDEVTPSPSPSSTTEQTESEAKITLPVSKGAPVVVTVQKPILNTANGEAVSNVSSKIMDQAMETASADLKTGAKTVEVVVPAITGATAYLQQLPVTTLASGNTSVVVKVSTELGSVTASGNMLSQSEVIGAKNVGISIAKVDTSKLDAKLRAQIGNKPIIELNLKVDGEIKTWSNSDAPVTVSIPYSPSKDELAQNEHIVVWYIDGSGKLISVPSGKYNPSTGTVTFKTTHFSKYSIAYVKKTFGDLTKYSWATRPIEVMASKGIIAGTSEKLFSPEQNITRGEYIMWLVNTLGLTAKYDSNFGDVKKTDKYYEAIAIAKKLGITSGSGGNKFSPAKQISRQDMMVLTIKALKAAKVELKSGEAKDINKFTDSKSVAAYAAKDVATMVKSGLIAGTGTRLNPSGKTTRAEAAVVLYKIYSR